MGVGHASPGIRTFLIADIRGYTAFTQSHGDEAAAALAARFAELVRDAVGERGGRLLELRGDEALCVFDSPRDALRAAVAAQRRFADEMRANPSLPLRVGIGIDAGEAVAVEGGYRGGALNLAARLCAKAEAGEVLVSEGLVHLTGRIGDIEYEPRGRVELKGMRGAVRVLRARFALDLPPPEAPARPRRTSVALVISTLVVSIVGGSLILLQGGGEPPTLASGALGTFDPISGELLVEGPIGGSPGGIAVGAGAIWVSSSDEGVPAGSILRRDRCRTSWETSGPGPPRSPTATAPSGSSTKTVGRCAASILRGAWRRQRSRLATARWRSPTDQAPPGC